MHARLAVTPRLLTELPPEILQSVADLLPTFAARALLREVSTLTRSLEWRIAAPYRLDEEMSGLGLGDVGARAISAAFSGPRNSRLGELCLGSNGIRDAGARALALTIGSPSCALRRLSLRDNCIGDEGAMALAMALKTNVVLEELDLWGNCLSEAGKQAIIAQAKCEVFLETCPLPPRTDPVGFTTKLHSRMRAILFDWLSQVHTGVNTPWTLDSAPDPQDMLFRTFTHLDAFFACRPVERVELQLLGVACTLTAAGIDESKERELTELARWLAFTTDGACTSEEVQEKAREIREVLGSQLHRPTAYTFLRRYLRKTGWTEQSFSLANYLIELAALDASFLNFRPQVVAAAAAAMSRQYVSQGISIRQMSRWKAKLLRNANVSVEQELAPCAVAMARMHAVQQGREDVFVNRKYGAERMHGVAKVAPNPPPDASFFVNYFRESPVAPEGAATAARAVAVAKAVPRGAWAA